MTPLECARAAAIAVAIETPALLALLAFFGAAYFYLPQ